MQAEHHVFDNDQLQSDSSDESCSESESDLSWKSFSPVTSDYEFSDSDLVSNPFDEDDRSDGDTGTPQRSGSNESVGSQVPVQH